MHQFVKDVVANVVKLSFISLYTLALRNIATLPIPNKPFFVQLEYGSIVVCYTMREKSDLYYREHHQNRVFQSTSYVLVKATFMIWAIVGRSFSEEIQNLDSEEAEDDNT